MNPADQASIENAKYNAAQARKDADALMTSAKENAAIFNEQAQGVLSQGVAILGKTGNLGDATNPLPSSGIDIGSLDSSEVAALRLQPAALQKQLNSTAKTITRTVNRSEHDNRPQTEEVDNPEYQDLQNQLKEVNKQIDLLGASGSGVADIKNPDALVYASGSDLLTMVTTRDAMERDKRTLMRNAQSGALRALQAGEHYDKMAEYAQQAASWNTWSTILSGGLKIAGMISGFALGGPAGAAAGGVAADAVTHKGLS